MSVKLDNLIKIIEAMNKKHCYVGIPKKDNKRENPDGSTSPIGNAALAYIHEHGSMAQHIPARPFMRPGVRKVKDRITAIMADGAQVAVERNDPEIIDKMLRKVGTIVAGSMQETINAGIPPPLSPLTVAKRQQRSLEVPIAVLQHRKNNNNSMHGSRPVRQQWQKARQPRCMTQALL